MDLHDPIFNKSVNRSSQNQKKFSEQQLAPSSSREVKNLSDQKSVRDHVNDLLNKAATASSLSVKLSNLKLVKEIVLKSDETLVDNYTDEIIAFITDNSIQIRCFVISYIEQACIIEPSLMTKLFTNYFLPLTKESSITAKHITLSATRLYPFCLKRIIKNPDENHAALWRIVNKLQTNICCLLDSERDGIRTQTIKYLQIIISTSSSSNKMIDSDSNLCSSLDEVPLNHPILSKESIKKNGLYCFSKFINFVISPSISSSNLLVAMSTLFELAIDRSQFMADIIKTFEYLSGNLPPTLAKNQVGNVKKQLKMHILKLLKPVEAHPFHTQITQLLAGLGASTSEISRYTPKDLLRDKKSTSKRKADAEESIGKKPKLDDEDDIFQSNPTNVKPVVKSTYTTSVNITAQELIPCLTIENVSNLVLLSMVNLPDTIPEFFKTSYKPIESAGTKDQIQYLARLLSAQITASQMGSGNERAAQLFEEGSRRLFEKQQQEAKGKQSAGHIQTVIGGITPSDVNNSGEKLNEKKIVPNIDALKPAVPAKATERRMRGFHLSTITKPLRLETKFDIIHNSVLRLLKSEEKCIRSGYQSVWQNVITKLVAQFGGELHKALAEYILSDIRNRSGLAFQWLYEEFRIYLDNSQIVDDEVALKNYSAAFSVILEGILDKHDAKEGIFAKMMLQSPLLTDASIKLLQRYCEDENHATAGLTLTKTLMEQRPAHQIQFLYLLLELSIFHREKVRSQAINILVQMHYSGKLSAEIKSFAIQSLSYLPQKSPPHLLTNITPSEDDTENVVEWTDDSIKQCTSLCLSLLPSNHDLISNLAAVYVQANSTIKRSVLRALDGPVHGMGMDSPQLLDLVENCPPEGETLVTRILHILTDKEHPTVELTEKVRDLHQKRVSDVRFLIPVLTGLTKKEVLDAIPKLILHNKAVVQGVISRLVRSRRQADSDVISAGPITPQELLVHLHNVQFKSDELMFVIKAIQMCLMEKSIYTPEVIVSVINKLTEQSSFPPLMMRTLLQALIQYPRLSTYVVNVLNRLISKKVWDTAQTWQGFIKCCQKLKPQSFQILLSLPLPQLESAFEIAPDLRSSLKDYLDKCSPLQRQHISPMVYAILNKTPEQIKHEKMLQKQQQAIQEAKERKLKAKVEWDKKVEKERQRQFGAKKTGRSTGQKKPESSRSREESSKDRPSNHEESKKKNPDTGSSTPTRDENVEKVEDEMKQR